MAKKCLEVKQKQPQKFKVREYNRCSISGRSRGYIRYFGVSRIVLRELAHKGLIPGLRKASW